MDCTLPFFEQHIYYSGNIKGCCYYAGEVDEWSSDKGFALEQYWNGTRLGEVREIVRDGAYESSGCKGCMYQAIQRDAPYLNVDPSCNQAQAANWALALDEFHQRKTVLSSSPVRYVFYPGTRCNLRCIMCCDWQNRDVEKQLPFEFFEQNVERFSSANELHFVGGEPFAVPMMRSILGFLDKARVRETRLSFGTNATLLHQFKKELAAFSRVRIGVGLDAVGDAYNYIRKGANWTAVQRNILDFKRYGEEHQCLRDVTAIIVVMKSSIPALEESTAWCIRNGFRLYYKSLIPQPFTSDEDVFSSRQILESVKGWRGIFERTLSRLKEDGRDSEHFTLNRIYQMLRPDGA